MNASNTIRVFIPPTFFKWTFLFNPGCKDGCNKTDNCYTTIPICYIIHTLSKPCLKAHQKRSRAGNVWII